MCPLPCTSTKTPMEWLQLCNCIVIITIICIQDMFSRRNFNFAHFEQTSYSYSYPFLLGTIFASNLMLLLKHRQSIVVVQLLSSVVMVLVAFKHIVGIVACSFRRRYGCLIFRFGTTVTLIFESECVCRWMIG